MILPARWTKIFKDMWGNKSRSALVILSIAVGVAAVGMITNAGRIIQRDLYGQFAAGNPARVSLYISPFQKHLADSVNGLREVEDTSARRILGASIISQKNKWENINLTVLADYKNQRVAVYRPIEGKTEPGIREILLERQSAEILGYSVGDEVEIELSNDRKFTLLLTGIIHDVYEMPFALLGDATGYVSMDTLRWMGESAYYNRLDIVVSENKADEVHVLDVAGIARDRIIENSGYKVFRMRIPGIGSAPGEHWAHNQIEGFLLILQIMGVMAMLLSSGLVINTISAILIQQIKQIGIMRSVGAVRNQVMSMYLLNVAIFSIFGLILAIPLGLLGSWWLANFAAHFLNFDISIVDLPASIIAIQMAFGLLMPAGVAVIPVFAGTRISVYNAIYQYGLGSKGGIGKLELLFSKIRTLNPPIILSLRNTFRKKSRLAFTTMTLTLAGGMFIASFSTFSSLNAQIKDVERYIVFDASLNVLAGTSRHTVEREAGRVPGVEYVETWAEDTAVIRRSDGTDSKEIEIVGLPENTRTIEPLLYDGTWFDSSVPAHQIVVNEDLIEDEDGIRVGSQIQLKTGDRKQEFTVVGIVSKHLSGPRLYMSEGDFSRLTGRYNQVDLVRVLGNAQKPGSPKEQDAIAELLEERFENAGLSSANAVTQHTFFGYFTDVFDIILIVLLIMAGLLAVVGGLGLTGMLSLNVLERTREIGVLRAVGAANNAILKIVVLEGVLVGLISWVSGGLVSALSSPVLASVVINAVLNTGMSFRYSIPGLLIWFAIVMIIGISASLAPAHRAALLQVREVLDYE